LNGWVKCEWKTSDTNRQARYYTITQAGRKQLAAEIKSFDFLLTAISRVMEEA